MLAADGSADGGGVGSGVGFGVCAGVGGGVGSGVGGGGLASADGSTLGGTLADGVGVAHGSKTMLADGSAEGIVNDGTSPLGSGVGTGKHVTDGLGAAQPCPSTRAPHDRPNGRNALL
jgi:hypothetical protein